MVESKLERVKDNQSENTDYKDEQYSFATDRIDSEIQQTELNDPSYLENAYQDEGSPENVVNRANGDQIDSEIEESKLDNTSDLEGIPQDTVFSIDTDQSNASEGDFWKGAITFAGIVAGAIGLGLLINKLTKPEQEYTIHSTNSENSSPSDNLKSDPILVKGEPPLTQSIVDEMIKYKEWVLEIKLPEDTRSMMRQEAIEQWKANNEAYIQLAAGKKAINDKLKQVSQSYNDVMREQEQARYIQELQTTEGVKLSDVERIELQAYEESHPPLVSGNPPLTLKMCDTQLEMLNFATAYLCNEDWINISGNAKDAWAGQIALKYDNLSAAEKKALTTLPYTWAWIKDKWPSLSETKRKEVIQPILELLHIDNLSQAHDFRTWLQQKLG